METQPTSAFSSTDSDIILQAQTVASEIFDDTEQNVPLEDAYEVSRTAEEIAARDYRIIALQFPDGLLHDSVLVHRLLKTKLPTSCELYILADTTFGSCCPDEIAAQHVNADVLVHYGHACLSPSARLPVIYVFGKKIIDLEHCSHALVEASRASLEAQPDTTVDMRYDVNYAYSSDSLCHLLRALVGPNHRVISTSQGRFQTSAPLTSLSDQGTMNESTETKSSSPIIFYVGGESLHLTNLIMTHSESEVYAYDPITHSARLASAQTNKLLMRRYGVVQRARDADIFGILVGTLAVASYLPMMTHLRKILARAKKKSYTISVGKLNPAKLANFMEIECFVLVACPENSLIESKDFYKPIITPFELQVALSPEGTWPAHYMLDFQEVLDHASEGTGNEHAVDAERESDEEKPSFSFSTGRYRTARRFASEHMPASDGEGTLMIRNRETALTHGGAPEVEFFQNRTFQGLEQRLDQDSPSVLEEGRSGIAKGYTDDHPPS